MGWFVSVLQAVPSLLPPLAHIALGVQQALGVNHPTVLGNLAQWVIRGDRRETVAPPPAGVEPKRLLDAAVLGAQVPAAAPPPVYGPERPGGGPVVVDDRDSMVRNPPT